MYHFPLKNFKKKKYRGFEWILRFSIMFGWIPIKGGSPDGYYVISMIMGEWGGDARGGDGWF